MKNKAKRWFSRYPVGIVACMAVVIPLFYLNVVVGRRGDGHGGLGWTTYSRLYGWPCVHGIRVIAEPWSSQFGSKEIGPLENLSGQAVAVNAAVAVAFLVGSFYGSESMRSIIRYRRFSLGNVLMLCAVVGGVCFFVKHDRTGGVPYSVHIEIGDIEFDMQRNAPPITDSPLWVFVPILFAVASTIYMTPAALTRIATAVWRLLRRATHET